MGSLAARCCADAVASVRAPRPAESLARIATAPRQASRRDAAQRDSSAGGFAQPDVTPPDVTQPGMTALDARTPPE
jgi:hypothetical protein